MKILTVVGARPQFVKAATVSRAFAGCGDQVEEIIVHTGQHYDANMSQVFFDEMEIPHPKYNLGIGGGTHGKNTGRMMEGVEELLIKEKPQALLVYGDTDSTMAGALAAAKLHIPVAHVEAGLRSRNMKMPEEINRIVTDQVSQYLFCPTELAVNNLHQEGFSNRNVKVHNIGDVMYDAAMYYSSRARMPKELANVDQNFLLCTIHRAENTDNPKRLKSIISALNEISKTTKIICPLHPRTRKCLLELGQPILFDMIEPVSYFEILWLLQNSKAVLTDSGGLQKEAYFFNKPCMTMRDETEWTELLDLKVNVLVGADEQKIINTVFELTNSNTAFKKGLYGDGHSANKIAEILINDLE